MHTIVTYTSDYCPTIRPAATQISQALTDSVYFIDKDTSTLRDALSRALLDPMNSDSLSRFLRPQAQPSLGLNDSQLLEVAPNRRLSALSELSSRSAYLASVRDGLVSDSQSSVSQSADPQLTASNVSSVTSNPD